MAVTLERGAGTVVLSRGALEVEVTLDPVLLSVERNGRVAFVATRLFLRSGSETEHLIHLTEGVVAEEAWGERAALGEGRVEAAGGHGVTLSARAGGSEATVRIQLASDARVIVEFEADPAPFRLEASWLAAPGERVSGLGARHAEPFDQAGGGSGSARTAATRAPTALRRWPTWEAFPRVTTCRRRGCSPAPGGRSGPRRMARAWTWTCAATRTRSRSSPLPVRFAYTSFAAERRRRDCGAT